MTRRESVIQALQHKETHPILHSIFLMEQELDNLIAYTDQTKDSDYGKKLGNYICAHEYGTWATERPEKPGYFKDDFGVVWNRTGADKDIGMPDYYVIEDLEDNEYEFPVLDEARLRAELEQMMRIREKDERFIISGIGYSVFERA